MMKLRQSTLVLVAVTALIAATLLLPGLIHADDGFYVIVAKKKNFAPVEKSGQTQFYGASDDGDLEHGVVWPNPRFRDNSDGTVTDRLTGLIWMKNANCFGRTAWADALSDCNAVAGDTCELTDGSAAGDWALANVKELQSLVHYGVADPALPSTAGGGQWAEGDPFTGVQSDYYWSSTTRANSNLAWLVSLGAGSVGGDLKEASHYVWCVRGGQ